MPELVEEPTVQPESGREARRRELDAAVRRYRENRCNETFAELAVLCRQLIFWTLKRSGVRAALLGQYREEFESEAWLALWRAAEAWDERRQRHFSALLLTCIRNGVRNLAGKMLRRERLVSLDAPIRDRDGQTVLDTVADSKAEDASADPARRDLAVRLQALIDQHCRPREAEAIRMRYLQGLTLRAIGKRVRRSPERVRQIILAGLRRLRTAIDPETLRPIDSTAMPGPEAGNYPPGLARIIGLCRKVYGDLPGPFRTWLSEQAARQAEGLDVPDAPPADVLYVAKLYRLDLDRRFREYVATLMPAGDEADAPGAAQEGPAALQAGGGPWRSASHAGIRAGLWSGLASGAGNGRAG